MKLRNKLSGYVVGMGKVLADGSEQFNWLNNPIKNTIVASGLDNLLWTNPNNQSVYENPSYNRELNRYMWIGKNGPNSSDSTRYGAITYMAYGTNGDATEFTNTALHALASGYTSTYKTNWPYCGSAPVGDDTVRLRLTYQFGAASEDVVIRELGTFGRNYGTDEYIMFSRIVLDEAYNLSAGESLLITYDLDIKFGLPTVMDDFFGLLDVDGNPLKAVVTPVTQYKIINSEYMFGMNYIQRSGTENVVSKSYSNPSKTNPYGIRPVFDPGLDQGEGFYQYYNDALIVLYGESPVEFKQVSDHGYNPAPVIRFSGSSSVTYRETRFTYSASNYTPGTFYRDYTFKLLNAYPNLNNPGEYYDIAALVLVGCAIRFGYYDSEGNWVGQKLRKRFEDNITITCRQSWSTDGSI